MIRENPLTTRRFQARAIGRDPRIGGKGIMASGTWQRRTNRSKTWPHPNTAAKRSYTELANGAPSRQGRKRTLAPATKRKLFSGSVCGNKPIVAQKCNIFSER